MKDSTSWTRWCLSSQYFFYFGVMGISLPYFNLYCHHLGFNGEQIGTISSVRSIVLVIFSLIWSRIADRIQIRRSIFILCSFISTILWTGYFYIHTYIPFLWMTIAHSLFYAPIISFLEAFTMDILGKEKNAYGKVRVWGSAAFIAFVIGFGRIVDLYSMKWILVAILIGSLFQSTGALCLPKISTNPLTERSHDELWMVKNPSIILFLIAAFLMLVSHGTYYAFFSIHLETLGYSGTFIGMAWALASIAEILVMVKSEKLFRYLSPQQVLYYSFGFTVIRWIILSFSQSAVVISLSQLLHAFTYGSFHIAGILYIDKMAPPTAKTTAQAINNAVTYGIGLMTGFYLSGQLYDSIGPFALFFLSAIFALMGGLIARKIIN